VADGPIRPYIKESNIEEKYNKSQISKIIKI